MSFGRAGEFEQDEEWCMTFAARLARGRARTDALVVAVVVLLAVLASTLLATLAVLAWSAERNGLRTSLQDQPIEDVATTVRVVPVGGDPLRLREPVEAEVREAFAGADVRIDPGLVSAPYDFKPGRGSFVQLTLAATGSAQEGVRLLAGSWPRGGRGSEVEIAVPQAAARGLDLRPGSRLRVRTYEDRPVTLTVVGVYVARDRNDPLWRLTPIGAAGVTPALEQDSDGDGRSATVGSDAYGPLFADRSA
ncbi:MAG: hypothetical protein M3P48_03765, partial [Actinomycetota bacterium]|nr:hypothetical protein [Actinomycetota bacterium]